MRHCSILSDVSILVAIISFTVLIPLLPFKFCIVEKSELTGYKWRIFSHYLLKANINCSYTSSSNSSPRVQQLSFFFSKWSTIARAGRIWRSKSEQNITSKTVWYLSGVTLYSARNSCVFNIWSLPAYSSQIVVFSACFI